MLGGDAQAGVEVEACVVSAQGLWVAGHGAKAGALEPALDARADAGGERGDLVVRDGRSGVEAKRAALALAEDAVEGDHVEVLGQRAARARSDARAGWRQDRRGLRDGGRRGWHQLDVDQRLCGELSSDRPQRARARAFQARDTIAQ